MKTVLLTGFEPFGGESLNPSWEAVRQLQGQSSDAFRVEVRQLPTVFRKSIVALWRAMDEVKPNVVICTGLAGGRSEISVERAALNLSDARIPDNEGRQPVDEPVFEGGPAAYWSTLPVKAIVAGVRSAGIPASVSESAGTFVCNELFYGLHHRIATTNPAVFGGLIHVPYVPEQVVDRPGSPSMSLDAIIKALHIAAKISVEHMQTN